MTLLAVTVTGSTTPEMVARYSLGNVPESTRTEKKVSPAWDIIVFEGDESAIRNQADRFSSGMIGARVLEDEAALQEYLLEQ